MAFDYEIPMKYVHEGTTILLQRENQGITESVLAQADMDGHWVSPYYGHRGGTNHYYCCEHPDKEYLNVRFTARESAYRNKKTGKSEATGKFSLEYNDTVYPSDWRVFVGQQAYEKYKFDLDIDRTSESEWRKRVEREKVQTQIAEAQRALAEAQAALAAI